MLTRTVKAHDRPGGTNQPVTAAKSGRTNLTGTRQIAPFTCHTCGGMRYLDGAPNYTPCPDCCVCPVCGGLLDRNPDDQGCLCGRAEERATRHDHQQ